MDIADAFDETMKEVRQQEPQQHKTKGDECDLVSSPICYFSRTYILSLQHHDVCRQASLLPENPQKRHASEMIQELNKLVEIEEEKYEVDKRLYEQRKRVRKMSSQALDIL